MCHDADIRLRRFRGDSEMKDRMRLTSPRSIPNIAHVLVPNGQVEIMQSVSRHVELDDQPVFNPTNGVWTDSILDEARSRGITAMLTGRTATEQSATTAISRSPICSAAAIG